MKVFLRLAMVCFATLLYAGCGADNSVEVPSVVEEQPEEAPTGEATEPPNEPGPDGDDGSGDTGN